MKWLLCVRPSVCPHDAWNFWRWGGQAVGDDFHGGTVGTVADILGGAWGAAKGGRGASGEHFHGGTCGNPR